MRRAVVGGVIAVCLFAGCGDAAWGRAPASPLLQAPGSSQTQQPISPDTSALASGQAAVAVGGRLHGVVKSGNVPLPGVTVTAQNTLTGKRFSTTTDIAGAWTMSIPQNGRYVIRTQFAAFAAGPQEALLNASGRDQTVNFELQLASRVAQQAQQQERQGAQAEQAIRQLAGNGAQSLSLMSALGGDTDTQAGGGSLGLAGAALPSAAGNADFSGDSVAISGQSGSVSPLAGVDMDRLRDAAETIRQQMGGGAGGGFFNGLGGGGFGGGFGGGGFGGGGGRRGNFRGFNPGQPHGAVFWTGSNSALNAEPFSLRGQPQEQPASGTNQFGITFMSAPYLPGVTKPSGKDTMFLTLSGQRSSSPLDEYATVPTDAQRAGNFTGFAPIYDPTTGQQFSYNGQPNVIPPTRIASQASALLRGNSALGQIFPEPNLSGAAQTNAYNYHLLTTQQSNATQAGVRYMRSLGANSSPFGAFGRGGGGGRRSHQNQGLRQSINFNYNWSHAANDDVNIFPQLGGKGLTDSNSVQAGYTVGYHKITNIFNASWNRSNSQTTNFFTGGSDVATQLGFLGPENNPLNASDLNYGLPNVTLSNLTGLSQQQPSFSLSQTAALSETFSWIHGKHNLRFGGDYRRVHRDFLGGTNATGTFYFTGLFTQNPALNPTQSTANGSALADFLLGLPQSTSIDSAASKSYLRENVFDLYATDDWRVRSNLTVNYGVRYEFFAPYTEKYGHLAMIDTNPGAGFTQVAEVQSGGTAAVGGKLPSSLVYPFRLGFAPRVGMALRLPKQAVIRASYGINFTNGQYSTFATAMAHEPMVNDPLFVNEQNNTETNSSCAQHMPADCYTMANGFPAPAMLGNYALDPHYRLPYVQVWNVDVQKTLRWNIVMNAGYNGSTGHNLDVTIAPRALPNSPDTDPDNLIFNYEEATGFSHFNAGTLRLNKRLSNGVSLGINYQYSHSIDDAGSVGGTTSAVAQNWQDIRAEESNSSYDQRHKASGTYLFELPFGKDKRWLTAGTASHLMEGFSISGTFTFASGTPLTPYYSAAVSDVACGTAGRLRPNYSGISPAGAGSRQQWFNVAGYTEPASSGTGSDPYCDAFGNVSRNSITGPGTIQNNMSLSKTMQLGDTRSMEFRATANNVLNTVQYSGVDTNLTSPTAGQVTSAGTMRQFQFTARFRF